MISIADGQNDLTGSFAKLKGNFANYNSDKVKTLFNQQGDIRIAGYSRFEASNYNIEKGSIFGHAFFNALHIVCSEEEDRAVTWNSVLACAGYNMKLALKAAGKKQKIYALSNLMGGQSWDGEDAIEAYTTDGIDYAYQMPQFPMPPPKASSKTTLNRRYFNDAQTLGDVDEKISEAVASCGYFEKSYFFVPEGFALVTRMEQTKSDGTPEDDPDRWNSNIGPLENFTLSELLSALFFGRVGYFRIFVFVVTPQPFSTSGTSPTKETGEKWLSEGLNKLPASIKAFPYTDATNCTILVYEFEVKESGDSNILLPGRLSVQTHLDKSKIMHFLER